MSERIRTTPKSPTRTWAVFLGVGRSIGNAPRRRRGRRLDWFVWKCAKAGGGVVRGPWSRARLLRCRTTATQKKKKIRAWTLFCFFFLLWVSHTLAPFEPFGYTYTTIYSDCLPLLLLLLTNVFRVGPETSGPPQPLDAICRRLVIHLSCRMDTIESPQRPPPEDEKTPIMYIQETLCLYNHCLSIASIDTGASFRLIIGRIMGSGVSPQRRCVCPLCDKPLAAFSRRPRRHPRRRRRPPPGECSP